MILDNQISTIKQICFLQNSLHFGNNLIQMCNVCTRTATSQILQCCVVKEQRGTIFTQEWHMSKYKTDARQEVSET
jgi:hypothetical protein